LSENGVVAAGEEDAVSPEELRLTLEGRGLRVQSIRRATLGVFRRTGINPETFLLFNQEFLALIRAGLTVSDALALSLDHPERNELGQILGHVHQAVHEGKLLSEACAQHIEVFDPLYISAIKTGEKTGDLVSVLARYQDYLRGQMLLQRKIKRAMAYPIFLLVVLVLILAALFGFVMPRFVAMYESFDAALPGPTRLLLDIAEHLPVLVPLLLMLAGGAWGGWHHWSATEKGRTRIDKWKAGTPILGKLEQTIAVARITRSLSTLLSGGTALVEALRTTRETLRNRAYATHLNTVEQRVTEGGGLAEALRQTKAFPSTVIKMVEVGESSGALEKMLVEAAQYYEEMLEDRLEAVTALIEPLLMLFMGLIVGSVIIVMYLPIFNLANVIR
ncbi:MAG: type II secretion system F family protein, partial [Sideroxydans sp.]